MTKKQIKILISTIIVSLIIFNLPFLPGPNFLNKPAQIFLTIGQFIGMCGLLGVPVGLIWVIINKSKKQEIFRPLLFSIIFFTPTISLLFLTNLCRDFSRNVAMKNGDKLITQIDNFKKQNGYYPDYLDNSIFEIPHSWIIGVEYYKYRKTEDNFELQFNQNVLLGHNFEIVTYNSKNEHNTQGEVRTLHPTSYKNWRYEIYD